LQPECFIERYMKGNEELTTGNPWIPFRKSE
jgi:hypothetical protein